MLPPTAVTFDLDGTLIDSRGDIIAAANHALESTGRRPLPGQVIVRHVGDGARALCARAADLPDSSAEVDVLLERFIAYYLAHPVDFARWMPGAQEALEHLADLDLSIALCTNKPRSITDAVLAALGIRRSFRAVVAGGDLPEKKPSPLPLLHIAKLCGTPPDRLVMVGDGPQDIETARRAGARAVAVLCGYSPRERLVEARPDVTIHSLLDLRDVLRRWRDATVRLTAQQS